MKPSILRTKSFEFALMTVKLSKELNSKKEYVMSKQLLRSGTSVGANVRESNRAESKNDFIHKLSIALKECDESLFWLELLHASDFISTEQFSDHEIRCKEVLKLLISSIKTAKRNQGRA